MQTKEQIKADAINEFVCSMIGALDSGFVDSNSSTLAEIHRVAQNFCKDSYGVELPHITEQWGKDTAELCGFPLSGKSELEKVKAKLVEEERALMVAIEQRDYWEEKATELANDIGDALGFEVGEHSNCNCPVQNAIDGVYQMRSQIEEWRL